MNIFAVDPGVLTGWVIWRDGELWSGEYPQEDFCRIADDIINQTGAERDDAIRVVCESYKVTTETTKKSRQYASLEIIGALRYFAWRSSRPFILQTPADAKSFMTDAKLAKLNWHGAGAGHATDALRHLGLYLAKNDPEFLRGLS